MVANNHASCWLTCMLITSTVMFQPGATEIQRLYSPIHQNSHSRACGSDEVIRLVCNTTGSRATLTATSDLTARIVFISADSPWKVLDRGIITGILLQNNPQSDDSNMRNFVIELHVHTSQSMRAINITCSSDTGSSSYMIIDPPATPEQPIFMEPRLLQQTTTSILYYLQWEPLSSTADIDHYQLYVNDTLVQVIHADQQYAVIDIEKDVVKDTTTIVKIISVDKCGQVSNYSVVYITPNGNNPQTTMATYDYMSTSTDGQSNTVMYGYSGSQHSMASMVVTISTTFLALVFLISISVSL